MATGCSIIVCTYNRLKYLRQCLPFLLEQNYPQYEIIIVNDGSTDGTKEFLQSQTDNRIRIIHNEKNLGLSGSRNAGIRIASYDFTAFTDDDCHADKDWLAGLMAGFSEEKIGLVGGETFYVSQTYRGYFPERLVANPGARFPMGCNVAYRKKVFEACGYFDDLFFKYNNEDSEMAIRAVSRGFSFVRAPQAIVYHQQMDWTVKSLLRSAVNASVIPLLKKRYPRHYRTFDPPVTLGFIINGADYLYLLTSPVLILVLLIRYLLHGKKDLKIFFTKWPILLILRRYYIYREAWRQKIFMI